MTDQLTPVAQSLVRWLRTKPGVKAIQPPVMSPRHSGPRHRLPLPLLPFLNGSNTPSFEIRFTYKDQPRVFRYFVEAVDDLATIRNTLIVHTNGELMVRVPDEYGHLMPNDIYYGNRSAAASGMGNPAPRA